MMALATLLPASRRKLDEQARPCQSRLKLLGLRAGVHCLELDPESWQRLIPALWKGAGAIRAYETRTTYLPSVRIYSFCDSPLALGTTAIVNAGEFLELDYWTFCETSRFNEGANAALLECYEPDTVTFRLPAEQLRIDGDCALITQQGDHNWGHWLVDVLPRIKLVRQLLPDVTIVVSDAVAGCKELLELAGIDLRKVILYNPQKVVLRADRIFLPSFLRFANAFSSLAGDIFNSLSHREKRPSRKLYITRSNPELGSTLLNHEEIEDLFVRGGFEVVSPEKISVDAQLDLFAQASHIAGEYGSGLHNSIFSSIGIPVLCLQSENMKQFVQAGIGAVMGQPTGFVFGEACPEMQQRLNKPASYGERYCLMDRDLTEQGMDELLRL